jgi:acyl-coenzyme A thioesterase PaaI-like protein
MSESDALATGTPLAVRDDHYCFGCGGLNSYGLHLHFFRNEDGNGVWAPWTPKREHEGYSGIAHGGIISTVLDEVMGWALSSREIWAMTARINVAFRKPVEIGIPTRAIARIERDSGRKLDLVAEVRRASDDVLLADATAVFVRVNPDTAAAWQARYAGLSGGS